MGALFGQRWTAAIPNETALAEARNVWGAVLNRLTEKQIRRGLRACAIQDGFPPSVGEFRRLAVGLPSLDECTSRVMANEFDTDQLTYGICQRLGTSTRRNMAKRDLESAVRREYRAIYADHLSRAEGNDVEWKSPARIDSRSPDKEAPARPEVAKKHISEMRRVLQ